MAVEERDPHTGYLTTGHEWSGIKELNTPVPRAVYFFLIATFLFGVVYWILMPAWPVGITYTKGLLGLDQRTTVQRSLNQGALERAQWTGQIKAGSFEDIKANPRLMEIVRQAGRPLYGDNCAACHGIDATGGPGFPSLVDDSWLWGGDPEAILETIRVGINSAHQDSRFAQMPAFGHDEMLSRNEIESVVIYVRGLSGSVASTTTAEAVISQGRAIFSENCASCHGDEGRGNIEVGAPNLSDDFWIYGGDPQSVFTTVWAGRQGLMPTWEGRLSEIDQKILTLYLIDLKAPGNDR